MDEKYRLTASPLCPHASTNDSFLMPFETVNMIFFALISFLSTYINAIIEIRSIRYLLSKEKEMCNWKKRESVTFFASTNDSFLGTLLEEKKGLSNYS